MIYEWCIYNDIDRIIKIKKGIIRPEFQVNSHNLILTMYAHEIEVISDSYETQHTFNEEE